MHRHIILPFILLAILIFLTCDENNVTENEPEIIESSLTGNVILPEDSDLDYNDITISLGDKEVEINDDLSFGIDGNEGNTGIIFASTSDSIPFLLGTIPKIENGTPIELNSHSTALSLAFLSPFICTSDPKQAEYIVSEIKKLPEYNTFANYIQERLKANAKYLTEEDETMGRNLGNLIIALINSVASGEENINQLTLLSKVNELMIFPLTKSGHSINYKESNKFEITNSRGRWAYVVTSENNKFFIPPNGTLLDVISFNPTMWAPSKTEFNLTVPEDNDTARVNVYGFGWNKLENKNEPFSNLTEEEIKYVHYGGAATILIELIPHTISTILTLDKYQGSLAGHEALFENSEWIELIQNTADVFRSTGMTDHYIQTDNYWGMMCYYVMNFLKTLSENDKTRETFLKNIGFNLTTVALNNFGKFNHIVLKPIFFSESLTNAAKTWIAVYNCETKAAFKIYDYKDIEFGIVQGTVHKENGDLIDGATVILTTEDIDGKEIALTQVTGSDGAFRFENVVAGERVLTVSKNGYTTVSVGIIVTGGSEIDKTITLNKDVGSVSGKIINEIFQKHGVSPDLFDEECTLVVKDLSDPAKSKQYFAYDGQYQLNLSPGEYRILADHENYYADSTTVTIEVDEEVTADDLILKPENTFEASILLYINNDDAITSDIILEPDFKYIQFEKREKYCDNWTEHDIISIGAFKSRSISEITILDMIEIEISTRLITEPGEYDLGGDPQVGCSNTNTAAAIEYITARFECEDEDDEKAAMVFEIDESLLEDIPECNCGITDYGKIEIISMGTELGDVVEGDILFATLPGYKACSCFHEFDGTLIADCARVVIPHIHFKMIIGHDYD